MITAVIIDDEKKSREVLKRLIKETDSDVIILGEADAVESGFDIINKKLPQLIFLDIEMLDGTGFNLLEKFKEVEFEVIFTTAYDRYAIRAFKYSAIDYLLKPISIEDLTEAILRAKKTVDKGMFDNSRVEALLHNVNEENTYKKLAIKSATKIDFVDVDTIIYCNAGQSYTEFHLINDKKIIATKPLKYFENILCEGSNSFFRISRSNLINLNYLSSYNKEKENIELENGVILDISRRRKSKLMEILKLP